MSGNSPTDRELPTTINGCPVEWREVKGLTRCYVEVPIGQTRVLKVPRYIRNPCTDREHDLTKLSDNGYLKQFLALLTATNSPSHIDVSSAPVLTFDKDKFEYREIDGQHVLVKREAETKFEEMVVEGGLESHAQPAREDDR